MIAFLIRWIVNAVALYLTVRFVPGLHILPGTSGYTAALVGVAVLTLINHTIKPVLELLTLPINLLTLGLFTIVILGFSFWLMTKLAYGISADGFTPAVFGSLVFSFLSWLFQLAL